MKILDRYVLWTFLKNYLISLMVLVGMYVVLDMVFNFEELADIKGKNAAAGDGGVLGTIYNIGYYYFYQAFVIFVYLSGMIPVVAAAFTLLRLSRFNELTAVLAAGVPLMRVAAPVVLAGVVLNVLLIVDTELVIPQMVPVLLRDHDERASETVKTFPIPAMQDADGGILRATRYTPPRDGRPAEMFVVDITERRAVRRPVVGRDGNPVLGPDGQPVSRVAYEPVSHVTADSAVWNEAAGQWDLINGRRKVGLGADDLVSAVEPVDSYKSNVNPEEVALYRSGDWVELLGTSRINELIARPGSYGQANLLRVKHTRFVQPLMNVVLLLLAIPCVLTREPGKLKAAATKCLALTAAGMGATFLAYQFAGRPAPTPDLAAHWPALMAWLPLFLFLPLAVVLVQRVKT